MLVSIDPGTKAAGIAVWTKGKLRLAFLARGKRLDKTVEGAIGRLSDEMLWPDDIAIEKPRIYPPQRSPGDPNESCAPLLIQVGMFRASLGLGVRCTEFYPRTWKGNVPKNVMIKRIESMLSPEERARVEVPKAKALTHNVWDAVGIGLYYLKRKSSAKHPPRV